MFVLSVAIMRGVISSMFVEAFCYKILLGKLTLTREDFIDYLNLSFEQKIQYPPNWRIRNIYNWVQHHIPSIKPLANILESMMYLIKAANYNTRTETEEIHSLISKF